MAAPAGIYIYIYIKRIEESFCFFLSTDFRTAVSVQTILISYTSVYLMICACVQL